MYPDNENRDRYHHLLGGLNPLLPKELRFFVTAHSNARSSIENEIKRDRHRRRLG